MSTYPPKPSPNRAIRVTGSSSTTRKENLEVLEQADAERARKRDESDARIDPNAGKWRYTGSGS